MPSGRTSLFGGPSSSGVGGGAGPSGGFSHYDEERENDRAVDEIANRAAALKRITIDIQEEADQQQGEPAATMTARRTALISRTDLSPSVSNAAALSPLLAARSSAAGQHGNVHGQVPVDGWECLEVLWKSSQGEQASAVCLLRPRSCGALSCALQVDVRLIPKPRAEAC